MIQFIQCISRQGDVSVADFRHHFVEYTGMWRRLATDLGARRVEASTTLTVEANLQVMLERGTRTPYDGVLEIYLERAAGLQDLLQQPEIAAQVESIQTKQREFVDLEKSVFFFATTHEPE